MKIEQKARQTGETTKINKRLADANFAVNSARYILEDLNNEDGMKDIVRLTGLPMGVVAEAFKNIFYEREDEIF